MYSGRIPLSLVNLAEVLRVADFLRMRELMCMCAEYMSSVCLGESPSLCLLFIHLVDTFPGLSLVSAALAAHVQQAASTQLPAVFAAVADADQLPTSVVDRLFADPEIGSVPETELCTAICRLAARRPLDDVSVLDLLEKVHFEYLSTAYIRQNVLSNADVAAWLDRRRPEIFAALRERVERQIVESAVDVVICGRRFPPAYDAGDGTGRLLVYVIQDDEWIRLQSPTTRDAGYQQSEAQSGPTAPSCDWLGGLECLVTDGIWLYALCSVHADAVSYVQTPVVIKRFCRLELASGGRHWRRLTSPAAVQTHCRLAVTVDAIYAVDLSGVVERYSISEDRWTAVCRDGFPPTRDTTLYVLSMLVGGDSRLYALRVYSSGVGLRYASRSVILYALDVAQGAWNALPRSDIDVADLLAGNSGEDASTVNFHSYVSTPGSVRLLDELGGERANYDLVGSNWIFDNRLDDSPPRPNFVGRVLGSVPHGGRVYCACDGKADFVMYDVTGRRYKAMLQPPASPSGVMCHARISRSSLELMTSPTHILH